ncbi:MAG: 1,6-anhydro-N-acetylmuramyl-L-alanine amidase AmpD [Halorhodospira sp.]
MTDPGPYFIDPSTGLVHPARQVPSPNQDLRPPGCGIELAIIHAISLPPGVFGSGWIDHLFTNTLAPQAHPYFQQIAHLRVSAHLLIDRHGSITQYVPLDRRAWHAGASSFRQRSECNDYAVGIELEGDEQTAYTDAQYATLTALLRTLRAHYPSVTPERIVGHSDVAPQRKTDPGPAFDWERLYAGLSSPGT